MKVLVPVKRVIDYNVKVRVKPDQTGVDLANDIADQTRCAKAQLRTRIPPHLLKDVGVEDG